MSRSTTPKSAAPSSAGAARGVGQWAKRGRWILYAGPCRARRRFSTIHCDVSVLLSLHWQSGWRRRLGCALGTHSSRGRARSRSRSLERAVIGPDGGVATPGGDARCSFHVARACRFGAGGRGRGHPSGGAALRCRPAGGGHSRMQRPGRGGVRGLEPADLRRDSDLELRTGIHAVAARGAATASRATHGCARAPRSCT